ncbi:GIY-YIG nuclease family protein [Enterovirga sp. CN4-39]|uniref:GIY-YIG nuclease family protein n=1 Tax=Enterovirga sp. CN4-39 TaxID=3400910 RepID=UPI003C0EA864
MAERSAEIYALTDPTSGAIRYIGKANDAAKRLKSHIRDSRRRNTPVCCWIRSLAERGKIPGLLVLVQCKAEDWPYLERLAIKAARDRGARLLNLAEGGDEPFCSAEVRAANGRAAAANRNHRLWYNMRYLGEALKRGYVSERTKVKMRARPDVFGQFAAYL